MGHTCPDCNCFCTCCGDIDDIDMGELSGCRHYFSGECDANANYNDEYFDYEDEDDEEGEQPLK